MAREEVSGKRMIELSYVAVISEPGGRTYNKEHHHYFSAPSVFGAAKAVAGDIDGVKKRVLEELKKDLEEGHIVKDIKLGAMVDVTPNPQPVWKKDFESQ